MLTELLNRHLILAQIDAVEDERQASVATGAGVDAGAEAPSPSLVLLTHRTALKLLARPKHCDAKAIPRFALVQSLKLQAPFSNRPNCDALVDMAILHAIGMRLIIEHEGNEKLLHVVSDETLHAATVPLIG